MGVLISEKMNALKKYALWLSLSLLILITASGFIIPYYYGDEVKQLVIAELNKRRCDYREPSGSIHVPSDQILDDEFWGILHDANGPHGIPYQEAGLLISSC